MNRLGEEAWIRYDVRFGGTLDGELPAQTEDSPLDAAEVAQWGLSHFVRLTALLAL